MKYLTKTLTCLLVTAYLAFAVPGCADKAPAKPVIDAGPNIGSDGGVVGSALPPAAELVSGGGKLRGGNVEMDIQIGHPTSQKKTSGGNTTIEGNSAIKR